MIINTFYDNIRKNKIVGEIMEILACVAIPFLGTTLGATMVFFMKNKINSKIEKLLLGFAAGVMIAASIWSLIIPSMDMAEKEGITYYFYFNAISFIVFFLENLILRYVQCSFFLLIDI